MRMNGYVTINKHQLQQHVLEFPIETPSECVKRNSMFEQPSMSPASFDFQSLTKLI